MRPYNTILLAALGVGCSSGSDLADPPTTGGLAITFATTGDLPDPDGYTVNIDDGASMAVDPNGTVVKGDLEAVEHHVTISGVADNCALADNNPRAITIVAGDTVELSVSVDCPSPPSPIHVILVTTGASLDPNGYRISLDDALPLQASVNDEVVFSNSAPGVHSVLLSDVQQNCTVQGTNPRTVTVIPSEATTTTFTITCTQISHPQNHAPVPYDDVTSFFRATPMDVSYLSSVGAIDEDGDPITYSLVDAPQHGTIDFQPDGRFSYLPNSGFHGTDGLSFRASDGAATSEPFRIEFSVDAIPVALPDTFHVITGQTLVVSRPGVLANDSDLDNEPLGATATGTDGIPDPLHGTVAQWDNNGGFQYTPAPGFTGVDKFSYRATEGRTQGFDSEPVEIVIIVDPAQ